MTQKILFYLTFIITSFSLQAQEIDKSKYALLWEISGNGLEAPSFVFGTMHIRDPRAFEFSDSVLVALDGCEAFATEVHPDSMTFFMWDLRYSQDTTNLMRQLLSPQAYEKLNESLQKKIGIPIDSMRIKDPQTIDNILNDWDEPETEGAKDLFLDMYLHRLAKQQGKQIFGVEKPKDQYTAREEILVEKFERIVAQDSFDMADILAFTFEEKIRENSPVKSWDDFVEVYQRGNLEMIEKESLNRPFRNQKELEALIIRNRIMVENFVKIARQETLFCAVGAAHLPGENGILQLLKNEGFTVRNVNANFTGLAEKHVPKKVLLDWYKMKGTTTEFSVSLPTKPYRIPDEKAIHKISSEVYLYSDPMTLNSYLVNNKYYPYIGSKFNIDTLYLEEFDAFSMKHFRDSAKVKIIEQSGFEGREFTVEKSNDKKVKAWCFLAKNQRLLFQVEYPNNKEAEADAERFFQSIFIAPAEITNWHKFENQKGAFTLQIPTKPEHQAIETPLEMDDGTVENFKMDIWMSKDLEKGDVYLFRYNNLVPGRVIDEDSVYFAAIREDYEVRRGMKPVKDSIIFLDGYEGRDLVFNFRGIFLKIRIFLRGHRTYLLMQQTPIGNKKVEFNEDYFDSFRFLPFENAEFEPADFSEYGFSAAFPGKAFSDHDTAYYAYNFPNDVTHVFYALDGQTGNSYMINKIELSPYFESKNVDTFLKEYYEIEDSSSFEEIITIDTIWKGNPARFYHFDTEISLTDLYYFYTFYKNFVYEVYAYLPKEMKGQNQFWEFVNHLEIEENFGEGDIFKSKKELIFKDLTSEDSLTLIRAKAGLRNYEFEENDLPDIYKMMEMNLPYDTLSFGVLGTLCNALDKVEDETTFPFLQKLFEEKKENPYHQMAILATIENLKHPEAIDTFFALLPKIQKAESGFSLAWKFLSPFRDSFEVFQKYYPKLLPLMGDSLMSNPVISMMHTFVDSDTLEVQFMEADKNVFYEKLQKMAAENEIFASDTLQYFSDTWTMNYLIEMLAKLNPTEEMQPFFQKLTKVNLYQLATPAIGYLLRKGEKIPKSTFQKLAKDELTWFYALRYFDEADLLEAVPKKLHNQEKVAFWNLRYNVEDDYGYGKILEHRLLKKMTKKKGEETYNIYIFSFRVKDASEDYLGFISQPSAQKEYSYFSSYFDFSEEYDAKKSLDEQVEKLLDNYEFE